MTYSIVARDKETGEFGVAVQSHYFQVSPAVPWALAGVGAVATQSHVNLSYGPLGLELLQAGYTAEQALRAATSVANSRRQWLSSPVSAPAVPGMTGPSISGWKTQPSRCPSCAGSSA